MWGMVVWMLGLVLAGPAMAGPPMVGPPAGEKAVMAQAKVVFREPFTLRLPVDAGRFYEQRFDKPIPYVANDRVYLFAGERFGVDFTISRGAIVGVRYNPNAAKADLELKFESQKGKGGKRMMVLVLRSRLKQVLALDALMTVPDKQAITRTSILPVKPGLRGYESWPHPIVQLMLFNFRLGTPGR